MPSEFELIRRHFTHPVTHTLLGVGDDAALIRPRPGMVLALSTDMLVAGTHFLPDADPEALGWKALAVNLSDMAAMGAQPRWALLAASLPAADEPWLEAFCRGFFGLARSYQVDVVGGDTTRGPLNLTPTIIGEVPAGQALTRSGARAGDLVWISGSPGLAALGLAHLQGRTQLPATALPACLDALHRPQPRVSLGIALRGIASACIDVSDGLLGDLRHVLEASGVAAELDAARLPAAALAAMPERPELARECALTGGDDYELLFTAPARREPQLRAVALQLALPLSAIGRIVPGPAGGIAVAGAQHLARDGFDHFAAT
jgi:thiamine-monophosphate kinase